MDAVLTCTDCGMPFFITASQQNSRLEDGSIDGPAVCSTCHDKNHPRCRDCSILMGAGHFETQIAERCRSCLNARDRSLIEQAGKPAASFAY